MCYNLKRGETILYKSQILFNPPIFFKQKEQKMNSREIILIQNNKIKKLNEQVLNLKCWLVAITLLFVIVSIVGLFEVKNFVDNPQDYLPPNWVEIVEVPQLEELK